MFDKKCNFPLCINEIDEEAMCDFQFARCFYYKKKQMYVVDLTKITLRKKVLANFIV